MITHELKRNQRLGPSGEDGRVDKFCAHIFHNHIKIITKLQNNHHSEPLEISPNRSPITKAIKKKPLQMGRRDRDAEWAISHPSVVVKN